MFCVRRWKARARYLKGELIFGSNIDSVAFVSEVYCMIEEIGYDEEETW